MKILKNSNAWKKNHDLTGKKYGLLKVVKFAGFRKLYDKGEKKDPIFYANVSVEKKKLYQEFYFIMEMSNHVVFV